MKPIVAPTCTRAWLEAATHLQSQSDAHDYNLILEISGPMTLRPEEKSVYTAVNSFLLKHKKQSLNTVINTIFPAGFYARYGADKLIQNYTAIASKVRHHPDNRRWGTYAYRMMAKRMDADNREFVPLQTIVDKLKAQLKNAATLRAAYEINLIDPMVDIPIYECDTDRNNTVGGPCLSHLSFKLNGAHRLMLTAFYRSHYYVQRALGNLLGLAWLQDFVAAKIGVKSAELVCISSMGVLEPDKSWHKSDVDALLKRCRESLGFLEPSSVGTPTAQKTNTPAG